MSRLQSRSVSDRRSLFHYNQGRNKQAFVSHLREDSVPEGANVVASVKGETLDSPIYAVPERIPQCMRLKGVGWVYWQTKHDLDLSILLVNDKETTAHNFEKYCTYVKRVQCTQCHCTYTDMNAMNAHNRLDSLCALFRLPKAPLRQSAPCAFQLRRVRQQGFWTQLKLEKYPLDDNIRRSPRSPFTVLVMPRDGGGVTPHTTYKPVL